MNPPPYGYEYWKHYHSDCDIVHVLWTDYCGIMHEKLVPADKFGRMFLTNAYDLSDSDHDARPLTVSGAALTSLPDGTSGAETFCAAYKSYKLTPEYDTLQSCVDNRRRATMFAKVEVDSGRLLDPREILKEVCKGIDTGTKRRTRASLEFQFVLRDLSDGKVHLSRGDGPAQNILQRLAAGLRTHSHSPMGLSIHSSDISNDGVLTVTLGMSENLVDAVDNYYRMKWALQTIASSEGLRPSFFFAAEDVVTPSNTLCKNKLRCRLHLETTMGPQISDFAAGLMEAERDTSINPSIYAFARPNWLTYACYCTKRAYSSTKREYITWGTRNSKTTINFPERGEQGRLEFADIDCMANMYLVVAAISILGTRRIENPTTLEEIPGARNVDDYALGTTGERYDEILRVPLSGSQACRNIRKSARLHGTLIRDIQRPYTAVRTMEGLSIMKAVADGRATSSRELLEKWY